MAKGWEYMLVLLAMICASCLAEDLASLLRQRLESRIMEKRKPDGGNPCPEPEKPFPCRGQGTHCIPMEYLCDNSYDCEDGYDEDREVCTAARRPAIEDIESFLDAEASWILPKMFGVSPRKLHKVAHSLAVSENVSEFKRRLAMSSKQATILKKALKAIGDGDKKAVQQLVSMPLGSWNEVQYIFGKIIKSGFE
ncbi:unnamed protein product [Owenia fusiformis]|uniref:Prohormone-4 n=1 Tax=Owenia fusiformis TaxID=6347 RepID=A0A8S4PGR3_OWEFU|nr:unnamed protein product [Owenia fusiformis]